VADLKRCDACHTIWDPTEHQDQWGDVDVDKNCASLSMYAPAYRSRNFNWDDKISQTWELCQQCARDIHDFIKGLKPKK